MAKPVIFTAKKYSLLKIKWLDSQGCSGWQRKDKSVLESMTVMPVESAGFYLKVDDVSITITDSVADQGKPDEQYRGFLTIPKAAILEIKVLNVL